MRAAIVFDHFWAKLEKNFYHSSGAFANFVLWRNWTPMKVVNVCIRVSPMLLSNTKRGEKISHNHSIGGMTINGRNV